MKVTVELKVIEVDGSECKGKDPSQHIILHSHWNYKGVTGLIVVETPDGKKYTVPVAELIDGAERCRGLK